MAESRVLKKWQKGDVLTATGVNDVQELLQSVTHGATETPGGNSLIRWVRMKERIGPADEFVDRAAAIQFYDEANDEWKDTDPEQDVEVTDPTGKHYYPEDAIVPVFSHRSGKLVPLGGHATAMLCKATADLSAGPVSSNFVIWSGRRSTGADTGITTLPTIELAVDVPDDEFFLAHWANGGWETSAGGGVAIVTGTLNADNLSGTSPVNFTIDGNTQSVLNPCAIPGGNGDTGVIAKSGSTYRLLNMLHTSYQVQTDEQIDGATFKFQKKTRTVRTPKPGAESGWTDSHTGKEC